MARVLNNFELARRGPNCTAPPRPVITDEGLELEALLEAEGVYEDTAAAQ